MSDRAGRPRGALGTLFRYEIKMLLRDRRTMLIAVVAPLVLFPLYIFVMRTVERVEQRRLEEATYRYAVTGSEAAWGRAMVERALALDAADPDTTRRPARFQEREAQDPDSLLEAGTLHVVVEAMSAVEYRDWRQRQHDSIAAARAEAGEEEPDETDAGADALEAEPLVRALRVRFRGQSDFSSNGATRLRERLSEVRKEVRDSAFLALGFPVEPDRVAALEAENTASAQKEAGALIGLWMTPVLLMLMLTGGSIVAADAISGEKERGTLETLLTSAATRPQIVYAKLLAVIVVGLAVAVVNLANLLVYVVVGVFELPGDLQIALSLVDLLLLLALFVPISVLVASSLLLFSGFAKTYKEYQIYFFPLFLVFLVLSAASTLPGIELRSAIAFVPVAGVGVAVREIMVGEHDWLFLAIAFLSTGAAAAWIAALTEQTLSTERLISGAELDEADLVGGPALFPRHVLMWFLGLWVVFFLIQVWFAPDLEIRGQLVVNLVGLFFGGSLLMVHRYRLDPREAFALRPVRPVVWLGVLVGVPSVFVLGIGLASFVNAYVFPVPQDVLEAFGEALLGGDLPLWQIVLFFTVMPGLFEEVAFRGVLLHGLSKRFRPVVVCLIVGAVFGFFHVSLFRLLPTGFLGVVLAAVTLLTGSIVPAMVWHALNNAIAIIPLQLGWYPEDFAGPPLWAYPLAAVGAAVAFALIWYARTPYPGLKKKRPREHR